MRKLSGIILLPLLLIPSLLFATLLPQTGAGILSTDMFESEAMLALDLTPSGGPPRDESMLYGPTSVTRGPVGDSEPDGLDDIPTEIVSMSLMGSSPTIGSYTLIESPDNSSMGQIEEQANTMPMTLEFPADSFFDVFVEISTRQVPEPIINVQPVRVQAVIDRIPPYQTTFDSGEIPTQQIALVTKQSRVLIGFILRVKHAPVYPSTSPFVAPETLKCYTITGPAPNVNKSLATQFGIEVNVTVLAPERLCVTANKSDPPNYPPQPPTEAAWKCYRISGHDPDARVDLETQFGTERNITVGKAYWLCAPVRKTVLDFNYPEPQDQPHLKCYEITGQPVGVRKNLATQFGLEPPIGGLGVLIGQPIALCDIADKTAWPQDPRVPTQQLSYKCYRIDGHNPDDIKNLRDQFQNQSQVPIETALELCAKANKTVLPPPPPQTPISPFSIAIAALIAAVLISLAALRRRKLIP